MVIKLTKENVKIDAEYPFYVSILCGSEEATKETISQLLDDRKKANLCDKLCSILMNFAGEHGDNEGAEECLNRLTSELRADRESKNEN